MTAILTTMLTTALLTFINYSKQLLVYIFTMSTVDVNKLSTDIKELSEKRGYEKLNSDDKKNLTNKYYDTIYFLNSMLVKNSELLYCELTCEDFFDFDYEGVIWANLNVALALFYSPPIIRFFILLHNRRIKNYLASEMFLKEINDYYSSRIHFLRNRSVDLHLQYYYSIIDVEKYIRKNNIKLVT